MVNFSHHERLVSLLHDVHIQIMLHEEDKSLLMLHPEKKDKIYRLDLNRHDVVEEWVTFISVALLI